MNYMEQVAQMLGVEVEEEFYISKILKTRFRLSNEGLFFYDDDLKLWEESLAIIDLLTGKHKIIKLPKPILDETEKRYLSNVIKPFRNRIEYITKYNEDGEYISIIYKDLNGGTFSMSFPSYDDGTMYKGMELGKQYTLEELGL